MIPKTIHYCWFGRGKKPHLIRKCIKSWRKTMPDYTIKEWNEDNFDVNAFPFVQDAYNDKLWAFVADDCRVYACYNEGGIYLDTDVETFKRFDEFLNNKFFAGTEVRTVPNSEDFITVDASAFGCEKGHWFAKMCMEYYHSRRFKLSDSSIGVVQVVATKLLKPYGYIASDRNQTVNDVSIYSTDYFANIITVKDKKKIYSLHHFDGSWNDGDNRGHIFKFCRKHDLMHIYRFAENITKRIR